MDRVGPGAARPRRGSARRSGSSRPGAPGPIRNASSATRDVQRSAVGLGVHGDGSDAELAQRAEDRIAISPRFATSTLRKRRPRAYGPYSVHRELREPADGRADRRGARRHPPLRLGLPEPRLRRDGGVLRSRWRPTGSTAGGRAASGESSDLGRLLDPIADKILVLAALVMLVGDVFPAWMVALDRRPRVPRLRPPARRDRARRRHERARPREAQDVGAGDRGRARRASPPAGR